MAQSILLADDSATVRASVNKTLSQAGYVVTQAKDGEEAIELAKTQRFDLAIVDIIMPGMDGYGVCEHLKEMGEPWKSLPIVFLTSVESHALELMGRQFGAYVRKPADAEHLLSVVEQTIANACQGID